MEEHFYLLNFLAKIPKRSPPNLSCKYRNEQDNKFLRCFTFLLFQSSTDFQEALQDPDSDYRWKVRQELKSVG